MMRDTFYFFSIDNFSVKKAYRIKNTSFCRHNFLLTKMMQRHSSVFMYCLYLLLLSTALLAKCSAEIRQFETDELELMMEKNSGDGSAAADADGPVNAFWEWHRMVAVDGEEGEEEKEFVPRLLHLRPSLVTKFQNFVRKMAPSVLKRRPPLHPFSSTTFPKPKNTVIRPSPNFVRRPHNIRTDMPPCLRPMNRPFREHRTYPRSWEMPGFEATIPRQWDWRNISGINYCSPNRNQHIPVYCGGCWVFGTLGALQDRFNVARKNRWPMTQLSPQEIIACNGQGSCNGGTAEDVLKHAKVKGLVEEGCNNYKAVNEKCTPFTRCGSCWPDYCFVIQNYTRYYVKDYGKISGRVQMMSEIHNRGPIACAIGATEQFDLNYTGGVFQQLADAPTNHIVSVSGWGWDDETNTEYWIVRNSWGDAWGEMGWFRIVTSIYRAGRGDQYNLGIERECYFADPDISNLNEK